jgi:hypothetical protein
MLIATLVDAPYRAGCSLPHRPWTRYVGPWLDSTHGSLGQRGGRLYNSVPYQSVFLVCFLPFVQRLLVPLSTLAFDCIEEETRPSRLSAGHHRRRFIDQAARFVRALPVQGTWRPAGVETGQRFGRDFQEIERRHT